MLSRLRIDPYVLLLLAMVLLATVLPPRGSGVSLAAATASAGIVLLFFLHGARLSRQAVLDGVLAWRLHLTVAALTYGLFPLLGLGLRAIPGLDPVIGTGLLFLTLLPSTVQSSIAFTAVARGNVAAAVCSASFSNLAGIVVTPLLVALLISGRAGGGPGGEAGGIPGAAVEAIVFQLLVPFLAGHLLRPLIGGWVTRQKRLVGLVDRGSILLVVYVAFGAAVAQGLWHHVSARDLGVIALASAALLAVVLVASDFVARLFGFTRADRITIQFCGSKKSLATGVPMAGVLFAPAQVGAVILPLMFFHQIQLMVCTVLAGRYARESASTRASE